METASLGSKIFRLLFGGLFTALGLWLSARVILQLEDAHATWLDWLILLFPALPLALGVLVLVAAIRNRPVQRRPFLRQRTGPARVFGSFTLGFFLISSVLQHIFQQNTMGGVLKELVAGAAAMGLLALLYGAINGDARERESHPPE